MKNVTSPILLIWIRNNKLPTCSIRIGFIRRDGVSSMVNPFVESVVLSRSMPLPTDDPKEKEKEKAKDKEGQDVLYSMLLLRKRKKHMSFSRKKVIKALVRDLAVREIPRARMADSSDVILAKVLKIFKLNVLNSPDYRKDKEKMARIRVRLPAKVQLCSLCLFFFCLSDFLFERKLAVLDGYEDVFIST